MTITRSADAKPGDLAVHVDSGDIARLVRRKVPNDPMRSEFTADLPFHPGWWVETAKTGTRAGGLADVVLDGGDWTLVTLDRVRAMAAAIRAGVPAEPGVHLTADEASDLADLLSILDDEWSALGPPQAGSHRANLARALGRAGVPL